MSGKFYDNLRAMGYTKWQAQQINDELEARSRPVVTNPTAERSEAQYQDTLAALAKAEGERDELKARIEKLAAKWEASIEPLQRQTYQDGPISYAAGALAGRTEDVKLLRSLLTEGEGE